MVKKPSVAMKRKREEKPTVEGLLTSDHYSDGELNHYSLLPLKYSCSENNISR